MNIDFEDNRAAADFCISVKFDKNSHSRIIAY